MSQLCQSDLNQKEFNLRQNTRFKKDLKAVVKLYEMFARGELNGTEEIKKHLAVLPIFQAHNLNNFCICFNNIRTDINGPKWKVSFE